MNRNVNLYILIFGASMACSSQLYAANECKVQYRYTYKQVETKTLILNAGEEKYLNEVSSVKWVRNKKEWPVSIYVNNKGLGPKYKWVNLPHMDNVDPPYGDYPNGVTLYRVKCEGTAPGSTQVIGGQLTTVPLSPAIRSLTAAERNIAKSVYGKTINLSHVRVTNTVGFQSRPWTTHIPPLYTINVGVNAYDDMTHFKLLLIHELGHVWQGQHGVPFMSNSAYHQTMAAIQNNGDPSGAYVYVPGQQWKKYNSEQQASIITRWFDNGRRSNDKLYPYIRDNVRTGLPYATTNFKSKGGEQGAL
ncbi:MAG: hypothetical protein P8045_16215 [Candidatus Thiodiazotropha sp.]